mgnify:FL=1
MKKSMTLLILSIIILTIVSFTVAYSNHELNTCYSECSRAYQQCEQEAQYDHSRIQQCTVIYQTCNAECLESYKRRINPQND